MSLVDDIKAIQRAVGAQPDGKFGPESAGKVLAHLARVEVVSPAAVPGQELDERTLRNIQTLDLKARGKFEDFAMLAKATAATFGCDYVMISGNRTWGGQDALYDQPHDGKDNDGDGRIDEADEKVTNAKGGQSNHNYGIAGDFGVFHGRVYLDDTDPGLAERVHAACAVHARQLGMDWGGDWGSFRDLPHFEIRTGLSMAQKRELYQQKGSVL